jgi:hypothetical protein
VHRGAVFLMRVSAGGFFTQPGLAYRAFCLACLVKFAVLPHGAAHFSGLARL